WLTFGLLRRKGELAVEGEGGFQRDKGPASTNPGGEALVELLCGGFADAGEEFDAGGAKALEAAACGFGIGVFHRGDYAGDACGNNGFGARAGAACVIARLEGDVEGGAAGAIAGGL